MIIIRIIFAIALLIYGIYNIKTGFEHESDRVVTINMFLAPVVLFICLFAYPPLFENEDYLTLAVVIVIGIFSGGGALFRNFDFESLPAIMHGVTLIATAILVSGICPALGFSMVLIIENVIVVLLLPIILLTGFIALLALLFS